jgi:hypothetical protein
MTTTDQNERNLTEEIESLSPELQVELAERLLEEMSHSPGAVAIAEQLLRRHGA